MHQERKNSSSQIMILEKGGQQSSQNQNNNFEMDFEIEPKYMGQLLSKKSNQDKNLSLSPQKKSLTKRDFDQFVQKKSFFEKTAPVNKFSALNLNDQLFLKNSNFLNMPNCNSFKALDSSINSNFISPFPTNSSYRDLKPLLSNSFMYGFDGNRSQQLSKQHIYLSHLKTNNEHSFMNFNNGFSNQQISNRFDLMELPDNLKYIKVPSITQPETHSFKQINTPFINHMQSYNSIQTNLQPIFKPLSSQFLPIKKNNFDQKNQNSETKKNTINLGNVNSISSQEDLDLKKKSFPEISEKSSILEFNNNDSSFQMFYEGKLFEPSDEIKKSILKEIDEKVSKFKMNKLFLNFVKLYQVFLNIFMTGNCSLENLNLSVQELSILKALIERKYKSKFSSL